MGTAAKLFGMPSNFKYKDGEVAIPLARDLRGDVVHACHQEDTAVLELTERRRLSAFTSPSNVKPAGL